VESPRRGTGSQPAPQGKKAEATLAHENSFKAIANEWLARQTDKSEATRTKSEWLLSFPISDFGDRPINSVTPVMVLNTCRKYGKVSGHNSRST
jgi:hypothetical protein